MHFASLGSGSRGNSALIEEGDTCLMVDCGFSVRQIEYRMARLHRNPADLAGILVTHEHTDHISGVAPLARKYKLPVWMTAGTAAHDRLQSLAELHETDAETAFAIDDIEVQPYPVPHDAREPSQFVFSNGDRRVGLLTDAGSSTAHIKSMLSGCDALMLESNHDEVMLQKGYYPQSLKDRVGGHYGHLSNKQAAELLSSLDCSRLQHVVAMHLSAKNNTFNLARQALSQALGCRPEWVAIADQEQGLDWRYID